MITNKNKIVKMNNIKLKILVLLYEISIGMTFELIGTMSVGWLIALMYAITIFPLTGIKKLVEIKQITKIYALLLAFTLLAEIMVGNSYNNIAKSLAVIIISFSSFVFLFSIVVRDLSSILWIYAGIIIRMLIFGEESPSSAEDALSGEDATLLKFYIGPLIIYFLMIFSNYVKGKIFSYILVYTGIAFIVAGARSLGLILFLIGCISWFVIVKRQKVSLFFKRFTVPLMLLSYFTYCIYITNIINGNISAGNNNQILASDNPYNPIEIIKYSRSDTWVGVTAWLDAPLWGHGSWAYDTTMKYHVMMAELTGNVFNPNNIGSGLIPGHSVIIGTGVKNGIIPMIIISVLVFFFVRRGWQLLNVERKYLVILLYNMIYLIWHSLFSPPGHIRDSFPLFFAIILSLYVHHKYDLSGDCTKKNDLRSKI